MWKSFCRQTQHMAEFFYFFSTFMYQPFNQIAHEKNSIPSYFISIIC